MPTWLLLIRAAIELEPTVVGWINLAKAAEDISDEQLAFLRDSSNAALKALADKIDYVRTENMTNPNLNPLRPRQP